MHNQYTEIVQVLTIARAKVAHRWIQGQTDDRWGGVCAGYAIDQAAYRVSGHHSGLSGLSMDTAQFFLDLVNRRDRAEGSHWGSIPMWNDVGYRTQDDVLRAFDEAIETAKALAGEWTEARIVVSPPQVVAVPLPQAVPLQQPVTWVKVKELVGV